MNYINITTPSGKVFTVPEANNREYYERLNRSIKDVKQQYKIEPYVEDKKRSDKTVSGNGNENQVSDIDLTAKVADLLPIINEFTNAEKLKGFIETEKVARNRATVIKAIQDRIEILSKQ